MVEGSKGGVWRELGRDLEGLKGLGRKFEGLGRKLKGLGRRVGGRLQMRD